MISSHSQSLIELHSFRPFLVCIYAHQVPKLSIISATYFYAFYLVKVAYLSEALEHCGKSSNGINLVYSKYVILGSIQSYLNKVQVYIVNLYTGLTVLEYTITVLLIT